jgi:hypothetical protein
MSDATGIVTKGALEVRRTHLQQRGDKQPGGKVQIQEEEGIEEISEIFNSDEFISKPLLSTKCTVPEDILIFQYPLFSWLPILYRMTRIKRNPNFLHCYQT